MTQEKKKPVFERRLNHIRVSVWANKSEHGAFYNTVIVRRYKDGDEWKDSTSFNGLADLALVSEATRQAQNFITNKEMQSSAATDAS